MDETQSKVFEEAASRKRRSSILKSQRAPRTPFSELEFNVATPTDTGKSRRVSFSRRTGVAEFVTNEATTTWKNFYEEHNKSLESSGHESGANAVRPSISHIGKRIFDQQFEEVEAVDFGSAIIPGNSRAAEFNISINNVNLTQQLAALECTVDDKKLTVPQQHFELSSLTDQSKMFSKVFSDDLIIPEMGELSNQINANFSLMKPMSASDDKWDELNKIEKDLEPPHNVVCPGPFRENMYEYIEVDLNMTYAAVPNDESDMSITDTVHIPKVQEISTALPANKSRQSVMDKDWTTDKENIAVLNPYVTPKESDNFAVNEMPDQVLVFDGKRLTVQSEKKEITVRDKENHRPIMHSDSNPQNIPQRKTIVLNTNEDLDHDVVSSSAQEWRNTMIFDEEELSMTQAVQNIVEPSHLVAFSSKRGTITSGNTSGNLSFTQAVPSNVILDDNITREKRKNIIYDNSHGNMSLTQAISANVLLDNKSDSINQRRTTICDGENVCFTDVPENIISPKNNDKSSNKTILFHNNMEDISFTQVIPNNLNLENLEKFQMNKTTVFERSLCNISMTQVLPSNIILFDNEPVSNKRKTILYENDDANISMTQAIPANLIITEKSQVDGCVDKKNTVIFENDTADVSLTEILPVNIVQQDNCNKSQLDTVPHNSNDILPPVDLKEAITAKADTVGFSIHTSKNIPSKKITITYDENADISMTQPLPNNILSSNHYIKPSQRKSLVFDKEICSNSEMQAVSNIVLFNEENDEKVTIYSQVYQNQNVSMTPIVSNTSKSALTGVIIDSDQNKTVNEIKHISVNIKQVIDLKDTVKSEIGNLSVSKPIPEEISIIKNDLFKKDVEKYSDLAQFGEKTLLQDTIHNKSNVDILVYQAKTHDTSEILDNKSDHDHDELKQEVVEKDAARESKLSIGIEKIDSTTAEPIKSLGTIGNNCEDTKEKEFDMQVNLSNQEHLVNGILIEETGNGKISQDIKRKKSILHELLDMSSNTSVVDEIVDKNITAQVDADMLLVESKKSMENNSNDVIFIVTEDKDETNQTDIKNINNTFCTTKNLNEEKNDKIENTLVPALEYNTEKENYLEDKLLELKRTTNDKKKSLHQNRYYEKILSSDLQASINQEDKDISDVKDTKTRKSFKEADDTKELLEMLSDFTDGKSVVPIQDDEKVIPQIKLRRSMALEHKTDVPEPKRFSFAPNRQSIVLTREELLNNLSMAQATLQQSRFDIEDSEIEDTATESPTEINESMNSPKKSVRMSNEVVKTLHFEDESCSDVSLKSDVKISPLKKTAFGETSYIKDCKSNVIPTYLKDVSDNIKALMNDLVKPRPDQMPFDVVGIPKTKKQTSTCSTQIQANLITSSQIDLDVEHLNYVESESLVAHISNVGDKPGGRALKGNISSASISAAIDTNVDVGNNSQAVKYYEGTSTLKKHFEEPVLVFDHHNPLNNVLLAPPNCVDVHKYNPVKSSHAFNAEDNPNISRSVEETIARIGKQFEAERVITQYNVESLVGLQSGDTCPDKKGDLNSLYSNSSKPLSMDRSTEGITMEVKTTEVNTIIAMKGNKELLEASSSLTLVDDALTQNVFDIKVQARLKDQNSPVKVIYKIDGEDVSMLENMDSDFLSNDDEPIEYPKTRKRSYSPSRRDVTRPSTLSSPDVTPKPVTKIQKISTSPPRVKDKVMDQRDDATESSEKSDRKRSSRKSKGSPKYKKPGTDLTVQQLIAEYKITKMEQDMIEDQIVEAINDRMSLSQNELDTRKVLARSPDEVSSCTSSKEQKEMQDSYVKETVSYVGSQPSRVDWQPELKELSSSNALTECESGVNVVAKIDMLPFMGSKECEWETSGGDTWVFRLLRARLRLRVRLAHRHHNALRTRVRADTPVADVSVDAVPAEEKDPLAQLCVRFAAEAMRYECGRGAGCARAGDVPRALRRCAGVARVALRWARAMRDARARLAYTLTADGLLTLKVANIPLRSVWEVSMRLELVVEDAREAAWPRAGDVRVRRVLADCAVCDDETARALQPLPHDWGHAPRTVWKIFRYLKNKTREDDFLSL